MRFVGRLRREIPIYLFIEEERMAEMEHKGTRALETERLILRRFTMEDAPAMYRN